MSTPLLSALLSLLELELELAAAQSGGNTASTVNVVGVLIVFAGAGWYAAIQASLKAQAKGAKKA